MPSHKVPALPILTKHNTKKYPQWHKYVERVYGQPVLNSIDLNTFTWFYYYAPFESPIIPRIFLTKGNVKLLDINRAHQKRFWVGEQNIIEMLHLLKYSKQLQLKSNDAFVYNKSCIVPIVDIEKRLNRYGFFVRRSLSPQKYKTNRYIEVLHVKDNVNTNVQWFWHTIGSGVFVDLQQLQINNRVVYTTRQECELFNHSNKNKNTPKFIPDFYSEKDKQMHTFMNAKQYDMIVFKQAYGNPEIIIRSTKLQSKTACALEKEFTHTGMTKRKKCICDSSVGIMNCAQSNTQMIYTHKQQNVLIALRQNNISSLSKCLKSLTIQECRILLNDFIPIHEILFVEHTLQYQTTFLLTLFSYALLFCTTDIIQWCVEHGGCLSTLYPTKLKGWTQFKHTLTAGDGAVEYYTRIQKNLPKHYLHKTHKKKHIRKKSTKLHTPRSRMTYSNVLSVKRINEQLPNNLTFLKRLDITDKERNCLNTMIDNLV